MNKESWVNGFIAGQCHDDWTYKMGDADERAARVKLFRAMGEHFFDCLPGVEAEIMEPESIADLMTVDEFQLLTESPEWKKGIDDALERSNAEIVQHFQPFARMLADPNHPINNPKAGLITMIPDRRPSPKLSPWWRRIFA